MHNTAGRRTRNRDGAEGYSLERDEREGDRVQRAEHELLSS